MPASPTPLVDDEAFVRNLAESLREAHARAVVLPAPDRRRVLATCLAYRLRALGREKVQEVLVQLERVFAGKPGPSDRSAVSKAVASRVRETERVMAELVEAFYGKDRAPPESSEEIVAEAETVVGEIVNRVRAIAGTARADEESLQESLERIGRRFAAAEAAARQTGQEFFDRILLAFNPESAQAVVGKKGLKLSTFYKASIYDILLDKYSQLEEYHKNGRLVRDFQSAFKKHWKDRMRRGGDL